MTTTEIVEDLPDTEYHADRRSLSVSGAKMLLPPSTPQKFRWAMDNPRKEKREFDFGHVSHTLVLGTGSEIVVVDAADWRTKAAKEKRDAAYEAGHVPILAHEFQAAEDMAAALREHRIAGALFEEGRPEVSVYADDTATGVRRRARPDWLTHLRSGRLAIVDYKTTTNASPAAFGKAIASYRYDMQCDWYGDVCEQAGLGDGPAFLFVAQEKEPPYAVSVNELTAEDVRDAHRLNRFAIDLYARCTETNTWPGWDSINLIELPRWAAYEREDILTHG
ncbi:exonuclease [Gordonia phage Twister6]|uniref:Cas4 family exonuclease n=6 Tax=Wizardvirus TaxID=2169658 RepID=A0A7D5KTH8_9CAUD|nr:exonuclease VIII [Gordonia phage Twister6]YP_010096660.1 exonuclease VIII [Gordonia phage Danyall]YP_010100855.1 exonuclease VIII [Gordonia phage Mutzi]YP_010104270.1 exonuclease VIII [Gordonia phage Fireball]YP_010109315.1 exonuclease VIII [Gordonia phage Jambalaya]YP_010109689.1 exonuclease VIII [Gordonia phage Portcullis]QWY84742.1 RecE-like exonuclease [Gordonia phage YungMoney]WKW87180.1 Cas4 family exonuclease [Gordonia phage Savbucketdawg]AOE44965.1 exonuclease [Gordonia phage Twi